ncbi:unnamed protein product [Penicillium pancosmium]
MKIHWSKVHNYRVYQGSGRPTPTQIRAIQGRIEANSRPVPYQRLFTQGPGSHYIRVAQPDPQVVPPDPIPDTDAIRQLLQTVSAYQEEGQKAQDSTNLAVLCIQVARLIYPDGIPTPDGAFLKIINFACPIHLMCFLRSLMFSHIRANIT